jgi:hypothetical protein
MFKFYRNQPRTLYLSATFRPRCGGEVVAYTALRSITEPARPGLPVREERHFTADVRLARSPLAAPKAAHLPVWDDARVVDKAAIYKVYFHGPAYQVLDRVLLKGEQAIGVMCDALPPNSHPAEVESLMAPRLIELCFQTAGIWEMEHHGVMALPLAIGSVTAYRQPAQEGARLYALVTVVGGASFDAQVVDKGGNVYVDLHGYRTVKLHS